MNAPPAKPVSDIALQVSALIDQLKGDHFTGCGGHEDSRGVSYGSKADRRWSHLDPLMNCNKTEQINSHLRAYKVFVRRMEVIRCHASTVAMTRSDPSRDYTNLRPCQEQVEVRLPDMTVLMKFLLPLYFFSAFSLSVLSVSLQTEKKKCLINCRFSIQFDQ